MCDENAVAIAIVGNSVAVTAAVAMVVHAFLHIYSTLLSPEQNNTFSLVSTANDEKLQRVQYTRKKKKKMRKYC